MPSPFDPLWERLLRGGVARRHARRYLAELRDHLEDLIAEERLAPPEASSPEARALARLGGTDDLARAMIARRELQAWSAKAPVSTYLIAPPIILIFSTALALGALAGFCDLLKGLGGVPSDLPSWGRDLAAAVVAFRNALLSILVGWTIGALGLRQRSPMLWPVLGLVVLAAAGAALQVGVVVPTAARQGVINLMIGGGRSISEWTTCAGRLALNLVLTIAPYASVGLAHSARADRPACRRGAPQKPWPAKPDPGVPAARE
jgi:hypothetical protein